MWKEHIQVYSKSRNRDPAKVEAILLRKGWKPSLYREEMREQLFDFLDKWYTLSVKNLPAPATSLRRNPGKGDYLLITRLPGGTVISFLDLRGFVTNVVTGGHIRTIIDPSQDKCHKTHLALVEDLQ